MIRTEPQPRLLNRNFLLYMGGWAITAFAYTGVLGVLFNLYLLRLGFGAEFIGALTGSGQLAGSWRGRYARCPSGSMSAASVCASGC